MSEMVERVARVLDLWAWDELNADEEETSSRRHSSLSKARTAIKAMREPTDEMIKAAFDDSPRFAWPEMIDEVLKE